MRKRFIVHRLVVALHLGGKIAGVFVLALFKSELGRLDVDLACRVGDMGDLRISELVALCSREARDKHEQPGSGHARGNHEKPNPC